MKMIFIKMDEAKCMMDAFRLITDDITFLNINVVSQENLYRHMEKLTNGDIVFIQTHNKNVFTDFKRLDSIKDKGVKILHWTGDVRSESDSIWYDEMGEHVFCTSFTNMTDVDRCLSKGIHSEYLQVGYDDSVYRRIDEVRKYPDISFMGSNYGSTFPLSNDRREMVNVMRYCYGGNFGLYGNFWNSICPARYVNEYEENLIYNNTKIVINYSHYLRPRYSSDRIFRAMGAGAMVISHKYPLMEMEFELGKHVETFSDIDELVTKINFYLKNEDARKVISDAGYDHARKTHTWKCRANDIKRIYGIL
jgi:spore maturation protein CgeB